MSCDRVDQRRKTDEHHGIRKKRIVCNHRAPPSQEVDNLAALTGSPIIHDSTGLVNFAVEGFGTIESSPDERPTRSGRTVHGAHGLTVRSFFVASYGPII